MQSTKLLYLVLDDEEISESPTTKWAHLCDYFATELRAYRLLMTEYHRKGALVIFHALIKVSANSSQKERLYFGSWFQKV